MKLHPTEDVLAHNNSMPVTNTATPENNCTPSQVPDWFSIAPETGVPINKPNEQMKKHWPMRVPILDISLVSVTMATGGMDTNPPEKKPYRIQKTMTPPMLLMPIQTKARIPVMVAHGTRIFNGPV
jgi:hypothetical protein